jgi:hypothetical protein
VSNSDSTPITLGKLTFVNVSTLAFLHCDWEDDSMSSIFVQHEANGIGLDIDADFNKVPNDFPLFR